MCLYSPHTQKTHTGRFLVALGTQDPHTLKTHAPFVPPKQLYRKVIKTGELWQPIQPSLLLILLFFSIIRLLSAPHLDRLSHPLCLSFMMILSLSSLSLLYATFSFLSVFLYLPFSLPVLISCLHLRFYFIFLSLALSLSCSPIPLFLSIYSLRLSVTVFSHAEFASSPLCLSLPLSLFFSPLSSLLRSVYSLLVFLASTALFLLSPILTPPTPPIIFSSPLCVHFIQLSSALSHHSPIFI